MAFSRLREGGLKQERVVWEDSLRVFVVSGGGCCSSGSCCCSMVERENSSLFIPSRYSTNSFAGILFRSWNSYSRERESAKMFVVPGVCSMSKVNICRYSSHRASCPFRISFVIRYSSALWSVTIVNGIPSSLLSKVVRALMIARSSWSVVV